MGCTKWDWGAPIAPIFPLQDFHPMKIHCLYPAPNDRSSSSAPGGVAEIICCQQYVIDDTERNERRHWRRPGARWLPCNDRRMVAKAGMFNLLKYDRTWRLARWYEDTSMSSPLSKIPGLSLENCTVVQSKLNDAFHLGRGATLIELDFVLICGFAVGMSLEFRCSRRLVIRLGCSLGMANFRGPGFLTHKLTSKTKQKTIRKNAYTVIN